MKKRINLLYMIMALVTIVASVSIACTVFYNVLKHEVLEDMHNYIDVFIGADAWGMVTDPDNIVEQKVIDNYDGNLRITFINSQGYAVVDTLVDIDKMENHNERPEVVAARRNGYGCDIRRSVTLNKNSYYYAVALDNGYVLRVSREVSSMTSIMTSMLPVIIVLCVILFIICMISSHFLTKSIVEPIEYLANNMDASESVKVYKELVPFVTTIKRQHEDIMRNANMRQEFTANVSHELKTPLTSISGYSELIESGMAAGDDAKRFAGEIHKSSQRLLSLINDIIRISELDAISTEEIFETVNLYETARSTVQMLEISAQKHSIIIDVTGSDVNITADKQMLEELIYNLCDNAIRYNNPGGKVKVSVYTRQNNGETENVLEVADNGIGIPKEHQDRIFERFYRVDKSRSKSTGGTGLGLAIVKHIVAKHHNAHIELESELGKGSKFTVVLKHHLADEKYYAQVNEDLSLLDANKNIRGKHILLAEKNDLNAEITITLLEDIGLIVERVEDGIQCVAKMEQIPAKSYDLILMDIQMPHMDGYKATQTIRQLSNKDKTTIPITALTANAFEEDRKKAVAQGMNGHISKPIDVDKIEKVLLSILK